MDPHLHRHQLVQHELEERGERLLVRSDGYGVLRTTSGK
jgi:hypothetical protein